MPAVDDLKGLPHFEEGWAEVNDVRLHYVSVGQGKLILFVHGFPEFWAAWTDQLVEFGRDYQAAAFDMRGYNLSSRPPDPQDYNIMYLTEDIRALAEHLGHRRLILVAHDWGGGVAWPFAVRYPDWLEKLVIINAPHGAVFARELLENPAQREASQYMLLFRSAEAEEQLAANDFALLSQALWGGNSRWKISEEARQEYIRAWSQPGAITGGVSYYRASPLFPPTSTEDEDRLRSILNMDRAMFEVKVPTLVNWGELDHALKTGNLEGLEDYIDDLTVKRVPDGTHWVIHEQPALVNSLIREFIE